MSTLSAPDILTASLIWIAVLVEDEIETTSMLLICTADESLPTISSTCNMPDILVLSSMFKNVEPSALSVPVINRLSLMVTPVESPDEIFVTSIVSALNMPDTFNPSFT